MTFEEFDQFSEELIAECFKMRTTKGKEYAHSSVDRFANFKRISERKGVTPEMVASIYLQKHLDGIESFINTGLIYSEERVRGRIVDAITYLMLIAGILEEKYPTKKSMEVNLTKHPVLINPREFHPFYQDPSVKACSYCVHCGYAFNDERHVKSPTDATVPSAKEE